MSITISFVFIHLDTTQYRHSNDNYQTSQRKSQDISHQIHQDCNSKRSWLCGGHHLTRQCMCGNCTLSNISAKTKKQLKKPRHVNSEFWNGTLNDHCGTVFITKPFNTNITMIITGTSVQTLSAEMLSLSVKASVRPSSSDHGDMLCGTEPYHANVGMMIPGSFHRQDTFRPAIMSTRTSVRSSLTHESGMVCITEPCRANTSERLSAIMPSNT